jgi:hypothetical protein
VSLADQIIDHGPYAAGDLSPVAYGVDYAALNELRAELIAARSGRTHEEWRATGTFKVNLGGEDEHYQFTWSQHGTVRYDDPEDSARRFVELARTGWGWTDGPHLHKRTVTVTDWEAVE